MRLSTHFSFGLGRIRPYSYLNFGFGYMQNPKEPSAGITNRTKDLHFLCFLEWDYLDLQMVELECAGLQYLFNLSDIHILESGKDSYHALSYDKLKFNELLEILQYPTCDFNFKNGSVNDRSRSWVLRDSPKGQRSAPKYIKTIEHEGFRQQSEAHAIFYQAHYGIPEKYLRRPDGIKDFLIGEGYLTGNRVKISKVEPNDKEVKHNG